MKRISLLVLTLALVFSTTIISSPKAEAQTASVTAACYNFTSDLYFGVTYPPSVAIAAGRGQVNHTANPKFIKFKADMQALHRILESEGSVIAASEKTKPAYGKSTASAVSRFQQANTSTVLTSQGLSHGTGILDEVTRTVLSQKYGCATKATVALTGSSAAISLFNSEPFPINWKTTKIPNTATLVISYSKEDGSGLTTISSSTVSNQSGTQAWSIPETLAAGNYKLQLRLTGTVTSDIETRNFTVKSAVSTNYTAPSCPYTFKKDLTVGASGNDVIALQNFLKIKGFASSTVNTTGYFGPSTQAALAAYQASKGLSPTDGYLGPITRVNVNADCNSSNVIGITAPKIVITSVSASTTKGGSVVLNWTPSNMPATAKFNVALHPAVGSVPAAKVIATGVVASQASANVQIPAVTASGSYKLVLIGTGVNLHSSSVLVSPTFTVTDVSTAPGTAVTLTGSVNKTQLVKGESITVSWDGANIPATTPVSVSVVNANTNITAIAPVNVNFSIKSRTIIIPATLTPGTYKIYLSTVVNRNAYSTTTANFTVTTPDVLPAIVTLTSTTSRSIVLGSGMRVNWNHSNVPTIGKVNITLAPLVGSIPAPKVLAANVLVSDGGKDVVIPANTVKGTYKIVLTPVAFTAGSASLLQTDNITVIDANTNSSLLTVGIGGITSIYKTSPIAVTWVGTNIPATTVLTAEIVQAVTGQSTGIKATAANSKASVSLTVPATLVAGKYKVLLSGVVGGTIIRSESSEFTVLEASPLFTLVGTPTLTATTSAQGSTMNMTATFVLDVTSRGGTMIMPKAANVSVVFASGSGVINAGSNSVVVSPAANIANGKTARVTITSSIPNALISTSGSYAASIRGFNWSIGSFTATPTFELDTYKTPTVNFVK